MRIWPQRLKKQQNNPNLTQKPLESTTLVCSWAKGEIPPIFQVQEHSLTILTLGADELFLRHGLQAETLQVEHAAALALAGQQRLARALTDLQQAESSAGNRAPWHARS